MFVYYNNALKNSFKYACYALFFMAMNACNTAPSKVATQPSIKVAAAASTQPVLKALQVQYQQEHAVLFENYVQASGKLTAQIEQGAAIDVFLSADSSYPAYLAQQGRTALPPVIYAKGSLALWSRKQLLGLSLPAIQLQPKQRLVLADPKAAPYGKLAQRALQEEGLEQAWKEQLVYGQNIEQVNLYLYNEVADFGLTAYSSVLHPKLQDRGHFLVLAAYQLPQAVALIQPLDGTVSAEARAFYEFLQSEAAQAIFLEYGYALP
ncbi:MAG: molybdate ABC transporter substrate-binding protein [Aureispira sp.]